jgi:ribose/xylose/arabinose/galactoside ABC-type transport system permease subunit
MSRTDWVPRLLDRMIWIILIFVMLIFALTTDNFLSLSNTLNILLHASILGVLVVGQTICLLSGNFDLSAEGTVSLLTVLAAWLMLPYRAGTGAERGGIGWEVSPFVVIPLLLLLGSGIGYVVGSMITRLNMNCFIVTLAFQLMLRGLAMLISHGAVMPRTPSAFNWLGSGFVGPIPASVLTMLLVFAVAGILVKNTRFGRELYAVGGNREAARASGFGPEGLITKAYVISGLLAGLAAWMLLGRLQASMSSLGKGMTLETVAASVIGGVSLTGGIGTLPGAFGGVLLLSLVDNGLNLTEIDPFAVQGVRGLIILVALLIDAQRARYRGRPTKGSLHQPAAIVTEKVVTDSGESTPLP